MVRRIQIGAHQGQDRPHEPLRLAQGQAEDKPEDQRGLDRHIREPLLPAGSTGGRRSPPSVASAESHRVTSPHWTSARSYSRQFPTRYVVLYFGDTLDFISRIVRRPRQQDQPVDDARRSEGQEPCTNACAGKARSRGTRCRDVIFETLFETLWVSNPIRPRSAASRNRVMRGPGVTQGAKRSQGARRPRN